MLTLFKYLLLHFVISSLTVEVTNFLDYLEVAMYCFVGNIP